MSNQFTLWQLLNDQEITIPLIQRDYAQGRLGKEHIRNAFLTEVERHLMNGDELSLDFVYGNSENGKFQPLDGQQRLTTLWLIHWYLAFRLKKKNEAKEILIKFSYQTRTSSSAFCRALCEKMFDIEPGELHIAEYIKKQPWFFSEWMQDPTINAMLRTISGDNNSETKDCIEDVFQDNLLQIYWDNLTQNRTVTFELMVIGTEKLPISDDLYIKMNARGKKLTNFENFKADWVSYIQNNPEFSGTNDSETFAQYFPKQIDNMWTDVFWNSLKNDITSDGNDRNIDDAFFSFVNRFVLNQHCLSNAIPTSYYNSGKHIATDEDTKLIQKYFDVLYGTGLGKKGSNDDSLIEYKGFVVYGKYLTLHNLKKMDAIFLQLAKDPSKLEDLKFSDVDEENETDENSSRSYYFLPQYNSDGCLISTGLKERIYFHAICIFLSNPNWERLNEWKRIVWNLTENAAIDSIDAMINCLRFIDGLGMYLSGRDWDIYASLCDYTPNTSEDTRLGAQWKEEKEKASKIAADPSIKATIETAEAHAFFKGTIRFLFTGPDGKPDWSNFAIKFHNAQNLFANKEKVSPETVKLFLSMFESFTDFNLIPEQKSYFFTTIGDHRRYNCWKKGILCNEALHKQVHALLVGESPLAKDTYLEFINSGAIEGICQRSDNDKFRYHWSKDWAIHRDYTTHGIYVTESRLKNNNRIKDLHDLGKIELSENHVFYKDFLWGMEISFTCQGKEYCWLIDWNGKNKIRSITNPENEFEWTESMDENQLLTAIHNLK